MSYSYSKLSSSKTTAHPALVQQVLAQNEYLQALFNSMSEALFVIDTKGLVMLKNKVARTYITTERHKDISRMVHPPELARFLKNAIKYNKLYYKEYFSIHTDALTQEYHISSFPLAIRGITQGYALQIENITQEKRSQQRKEHEHSLRFLSNVADELIHEIKNPLGAMSLHIQLLNRRLIKDGILSPQSVESSITEDLYKQSTEKNAQTHTAAPPSVGSASESSARTKRINPQTISSTTLRTLVNTIPVLELELNTINSIVSNLKKHSSTPSYDMIPMDINILVKELSDFLSLDTQGKKIKVHVSMAPNLPKVLLSHSAIMQVLYNLTKNAMESMHEQGNTNGGDLSISTSVCGNHVCLIISDSGTGIATKDLPHVFQPYYTTKAKGTGLGLSIVFRIIMMHGGYISVDKNYREGARFIIEFPVHADEHHLLGTGI